MTHHLKWLMVRRLQHLREHGQILKSDKYMLNSLISLQVNLHEPTLGVRPGQHHLLPQAHHILKRVLI